MTAYYNEIDPVAAEWLRRLIARDLIAPGEVDERDIRDVTPAELVRFTQCHFFAGIGIWSLALRSAGWDDGRRIWTGSCPCQPFSAAGAGEGFADERHLWPHWHWLIEHCRPEVVVGEQVASKDGLGWHDLVSDDLAGIDYASGAVVISAAGFGVGWRGSAESQRLERALRLCPDPMVARHLAAFADWADQSLAIDGFHIRERQYFVGLADGEGRGRGVGGDASLARPGGHADRGSDAARRLADSDRAVTELAPGQGPRPDDPEGRRPRSEPAGRRDADGLDDAGSVGRGPGRDRDQRGNERLEPAADGQDGGVDLAERPGLEGRGQGPAGPGLRERGREGPDGPATAPGADDGMGDADDGRHDRAGDARGEGSAGSRADAAPRHPAPTERVADGDGERRGQHGEALDDDRQLEPGHDDDGRGSPRGLAYPDGRDAGPERQQRGGLDGQREADRGPARAGDLGSTDVGTDGAGEADGVRGTADWLLCRDGLWRPARPGSFPLAHAVAGRVGQLRAYGNGLDFETAKEFCATVREIVDERVG